MLHPSPLRERTAAARGIEADFAGWSMPSHFGNPAAEYELARSKCVLVDQSHHGKVVITGRDAASFLHNLCTNDITGMPVGAGCEAFFCNLKAKIVSHAYIYHTRQPDGSSAFWLDVVPGESVNLIAHLNRFIIAEQVELTDRTAEFAQVHLAGPNATAVLASALADHVPDLDPLLHMERTFGVSVHAHIRRNDTLGATGYDIVCRNEVATGLWRVLVNAGAQPAGLEAWNILRLEAGTPIHRVDYDENRYAFEIGRTEKAICFTKGCYLGQEPIVMARDRAGHAPRTLIGIRLADKEPVAPSTRIHHLGEDVGWITSSQFSPKLGTAIALGFVRHGHNAPGTELTVFEKPAVASSLPF